jgi:site-specific DNA-cytosine methylase
MRAGIAAPLQPWRTVYDALPGIHAEALLRSGGPGRANADRPIHIPAPTVPACDGNLYLSRADGQQARRRLQPDECAALQDLPTWWPLHRLPTMREAYAAVGNAVPRTVAKRLAEQLLLADHDHTGVTRP